MGGGESEGDPETGGESSSISAPVLETEEKAGEGSAISTRSLSGLHFLVLKSLSELSLNLLVTFLRSAIVDSLSSSSSE